MRAERLQSAGNCGLEFPIRHNLFITNEFVMRANDALVVTVR